MDLSAQMLERIPALIFNEDVKIKQQTAVERILFLLPTGTRIHILRTATENAPTPFYFLHS